MRNIWTIFRRDMKRIRQNVIALIVIIGISVVPCLYAWFNIAASWDPYSNTGNLKVAVASEDEGYEGSLIPIEINVGDQVLSSLRENSQMEWVFTSAEKAKNGVKSGKYYAAIVIPSDFSDKMMSVFSEDVEKPEITYYSNAKENAIAPKVTDKGASSVQQKVNEIFIETISDTALTVLQAVSNMSDASDAETIVANLNENLNQISGDLTASAGLLTSFSDLTGSTQALLTTTTEFLEMAQDQSAESRESFKETKQSVSDLDGAVEAAADSVGTALDQTKDVYAQMSRTISQALADEDADVQAVADTLDTLSAKTDQMISSYSAIRDQVAQIGQKYPSLEEETGKITAGLDDFIQTQKNLKEKMQNAASSLRSATTDLASAKQEMEEMFEANDQTLADVTTEYEQSMEKSLDALSGSLGTSADSLSALLDQIAGSTDGITEMTEDADSDLTEIQTVLTDSAKLLTAASDKIVETTAKLDEMEQSGDFDELESLISGDKSGISAFLAAPVSLKTHKVYEIENYGSSMAPFYSTLSIWIGGVVMVAMLKVNVSEECTKGLKNVKLRQLYFGRMLLFLLVGLMQSTLIGLGDLFYLKIQCEYPLLFLLGCWFTSIVYVMITYTLTVSLGDIGKAVCVILLVVQVAGTGGTFPIEVAPSFFKAVYPLLPFTHSMAALRETVGGMYRMDYWIDLGKLGIFLLIALFVGLVLRKPIIKANEAFMEKLEETKLM